MAENTLKLNITFPIKNADGSSFHGLVLHKAAFESSIMSLGDKISGDVVYKNNNLNVTMLEYIEYKGVKYTLVNPPTIVREGLVKDNQQLNGMTKYSFVFYHPMYMLSNFPFTDVAVNSDEEKYLSQNKTFSWIGTLQDFINKLNANLVSTEWYVTLNVQQYAQDGVTTTPEWDKASKLSDVMQFDGKFISDALKDAYDTWKIPFVVTNETQTIDGVQKKYLIEFGFPSQEIYTLDEHGGQVPYVFRFGKGVGLRNNSRNPRNNKIITRISGYGAERNIPFGYPQIIWTGNQDWNFTLNNADGMQWVNIGGLMVRAMSYPIYDGIVGGTKVRLIKHPFTRTHLMPSVYTDCVNKKVNPYAIGYNPNIKIIDYYDATSDGTWQYPNEIVITSPSCEIHGFDDIYPKQGDASIVQVLAYDDKTYISFSAFTTIINQKKAQATNENEVQALTEMLVLMENDLDSFSLSNIGGSYTFKVVGNVHEYSGGVWYDVKMTSDTANFEYNVFMGNTSPESDVQWDDAMDDDGNYLQSYFKLTLPILSFDVYASASITEEMKINMRSGACLGCTFPIQVDWDDYKKNFYKEDGTFDPVPHTQPNDGHVRDAIKYPLSNQTQITVIVQKDNETFGTLMPNRYQKPIAGDKFVLLGISLPNEYITTAEQELSDAMKEYMLENNVYYYDYPLKFDDYFMATHSGILDQMDNNSIVRFKYANADMALYIKQITVKYGESTLPTYDITLTDDVEVVLNKIGQVTDDVSRLRVQFSELQKYYSENVIQIIQEKLSKVEDDICQGRITFQQGLNALGSVIFSDEIKSPNYETGLYTGTGWRIDELGNAELESIRVRSYLEVVELLVNRLQAQEGDTLFTDNDQIDRVDRQEQVIDGQTIVSYVLSLKEKYQGYVTCQQYNNIIKGIINTLAANQAGVSDETQQSIEVDGENKYYTSWMRVINTHTTNPSLGINQIEVVLYGDNMTPAGRNFPPCELMTIARWGCVNYASPSDPQSLKDSITRRQRMFMISSTDGRVVKYTGVTSPILQDSNYGVSIGELPEFVKNYSSVRPILEQVGEHSDWLYAQGVVVGNYIKVDYQGRPISVNVYCGDWVDGSQVQQPMIGAGIYYCDEYNEDTKQYEIHEVRHNGGRWQCMQHQPVISGGVETYYEPRWNSPYWKLVDGNSNLSIEFVSSRGYSFRHGDVNTEITPHVFYGNVDITNDILEENFTWTRYEQNNESLPDPYTQADKAWNSIHEGQKLLTLTNVDMPNTWSSLNKIIFTLTVIVNDGQSTRIVDNQIIT